MRILYFALAILPCAAVACDGAQGGGSLVGPGGSAPVAAVAVSPQSATVVVNGVAQLTAVALDADGNAVADAPISWGTSDNEVAQVSTAGRVTARTVGNVRITATSNHIEGSATIDVIGDAGTPVATVSVALAASALVVGQSTQATATLRDQSGAVLGGRTVTWSSSNASVATVAQDGHVTAVGAGSATVTATSEGKSGSAALAVSTPPATPVASVSVTPGTGVVETAKTLQLTATLRDASGNPLTGRTVTWTSSAEAVATVSSSGLVTGVSVGTATITASSEGKTGSATVQVSPAAPPGVVSVLITPETATIDALNQTVQLTATAKDANGNTVSGVTFLWRSVNTAVATVGAAGSVTSKGVGTVLVIAAAGLIADTASITVRQLPATMSLNVTSATVSVGSTRQLQATVRDAGGSAIPGSPVSWASSAASIASVSSSGLVTGVAAGSATITATAGTLTASASITVEAAPPPPPPPPGGGIWISPQEIAALPMTGTAWNNVKSAADASCGTPDLENQDDGANVCVMAKALVFARTNQNNYRDDVVAAIQSIVNAGTYGGRALALGRELMAYVIAAELVGLSTYNPTLDQEFRAKLRELRTTTTSGGPSSLIECHEVRPNNWGLHCGASRMAVALYLGDRTDFDRAVLVFRGWLGERQAYAGFEWGDLSWQADPANPVGINPQGATKDGHSIDGVLPDDQRRCGSFGWPPCHTGYNWEAMQGVVAMALMAQRQGHPAFEWSNRAILRASRWLYEVSSDIPSGDDGWLPHAVNYAYGTTFLAPTPANPGKNMGWTDWTHPRR